MILVNPPQGANRDLPNLSLGFAEVDAPVLDLNTCPALHVTTPEHRYAVQTRSLRWVQNLGVSRSITTESISIMCSYQVVPLSDNLHVPRLAVPDYSRFNSYSTFITHWQRGSWPYPVLTSTGCPYGCAFCAAHYGKWKARPKDHLARELRQVDAKIRPKCFQIVDECFNVRTDHLLGVCSLLDGREWMCTNGLRADRLTLEQARAMSRSGCTTVAFGLEVADNHLLTKWHKGETLYHLDRGVRLAKDWFPSVSVYVIKDLPGSTQETYQHTLDWAAERGAYVHASRYQDGDGIFEELPTPLDSPAGRLTTRWPVLRRWGWHTACRYWRMDWRKAWRRATRVC